MENFFQKWLRGLAVSVAIILSTVSGAAQAAELGSTVENVATLTIPDGAGNSINVLTNPATFVIEARRTESKIQFYRYAPGVTNPEYHKINGSDYIAGDGPFVPLPPAINTHGRVIDLTNPIPLLPAETYLTGEIIFVSVTDLGQNGDPNKIETVNISVDTGHGDSVTLRLYESGPDKGVFFAYIPSTYDDSPPHDHVLTTPTGTQLNAYYVDSFDSLDVSKGTALVDPYGRVFHSSTGQMVDGAVVSVVNTATGEPAKVYGIDGQSAYPSTMISGQDVTDASGTVYTMRPGEFRFPLMELGEYHITVDPPKGYSFASSFGVNDFESLENMPFVIEPKASYGGNFALVSGTGPLNLDLPVDGDSDLVLTKTANLAFADVGDTIGYTVSIKNNGINYIPVKLQDTLPHGARYIEGSAKLGGVVLSDPELSDDSQMMTFDLGVLNIEDSMSLTYAVEISAGAKIGDFTNAIVSVNGAGQSISNIARSTIQIREDLLRSTSTIVGRIAEQACDGEDGWAREIKRGKGVEGVRLYMENGAYAISDEDGLYHFQGVKTGAHVVQVDKVTLPAGYEMMACEENSRYAGRDFSKFIDVKGGGLWRANFFLKQTGEKAVAQDEHVFNDTKEYLKYDKNWLETQTADVEWVYPSATRTPSKPSVNIGIKHGPNEKVELTLNGKPVPSMNFDGRPSNAARTVTMSKWRSVDILDDSNVFVAKVTDKSGKTVKTITRELFYVKTISRATALPDQSTLIADGRTTPEFAVRLEDEAGRPVHAGLIAEVQVKAPYRLYNESRLEGEEELVSPLSASADVVVGADGIAHVTLEPTLQTGKVTVIVSLDDGREVELFMYLEPEKRDWIIVGLAEGSTAYNTLKNKTIALDNGAHDELNTDGRVAFFAKGLIKGEWLLTLAVDTDKRRDDRDGLFRNEINPNAYYTLYGDRSYVDYEAQSRYPVYLKIEKKTFYAMFGDFDTNITEGKLTRYSRYLSGLKGEYLGKKFQALGFAAETNQGFTKDEIAAIGTSGPYRLSNAPIIGGSERIRIETRDRTRPDKILKTRNLIRHLDYTLDNLTGELVFRLPIDVTDSGFNPNVIVVDYETTNDAERNVTFGGRVQTQILGDKVKLGSSFVHEGGNSSFAGASADMVGADLVAQLRPGTEMRLEYAMTSNKDDQSDRSTANAYLAEIIHTSEKLSADAYVRQEEGGFGLGQRGSNTADIRRYGANATYQLDEFESKKTGRRGTRNVQAKIYREENLATGGKRTLSEIGVNQDGEKLGLSAGLRQVKDENPNGLSHESLLALAKLRYRIPKHGASFEISREQPLSSKNAVDDFPARTRISVDKTITDKASIKLTHDILDGDQYKGQNTALGVTYKPWNGTQITAGSDITMNESGRQIGATVGLDQQFQLNDKWSASFGLANRQVFNSGTTIDQIAPDAATSLFEINEGFTSAYAGLGYRTEKMSMSGRFETLNGQASNSNTLAFSAARELSEEVSFAGAFRAQTRDQDDPLGTESTRTSKRIEARLGGAWRPRDEHMILLNRFDMVYNDAPNGTKTRKLVNNLALNSQVNDRWQLSANYGVKYVETTFQEDQYSGFSQLFGAETRFDVSKKIDLGLHGSVLTTNGFNQLKYAYGPSIGIAPVDNVWISLGYNVDGFRDEDFNAAEYSQQGPYIQFRLKFDQHSLRGMLDMISPSNQ